MNENTLMYRIKYKCSKSLSNIYSRFQRAIKGYSDFDAYDFIYSIPKLLEKMLTTFKANNNAKWYDSDINKQLTFEETQAIIDRMITLLHIMNDDWVNYPVFQDVYRMKKEIDKFTMRQIEAQKEFFGLFTKWYNDLWI